MRRRDTDTLDQTERRKLIAEYRAVMRRYREILRELEQSETGTGVNWATVALGILGALILGGVLWLFLH